LHWISPVATQAQAQRAEGAIALYSAAPK
jgi:hypothetical protein